MGKGVGMTTAFQVATKSPVRASEVTAADAPFLCDRCQTPVELVSGYWTRKEDLELAREVQAFFRLRRGEANQHTPGCIYLPRGQVQVLVDDAIAVEDTINPFEPAQGGQGFIFRLNIPVEEMRRGQEERRGGGETERYSAVCWQPLLCRQHPETGTDLINRVKPPVFLVE